MLSNNQRDGIGEEKILIRKQKTIKNYFLVLEKNIDPLQSID